MNSLIRGKAGTDQRPNRRRPTPILPQEVVFCLSRGGAGPILRHDEARVIQVYTLHAWPDSASLIVRLVLEELGLPHVSRRIDRAAGELDSPAYRAIHPLGKIPAFETPDGPMFETAAILLYLSDRHPGLAPAPTSPERAAFLKWFFFTSGTLHPAVMDGHYPERVAGAEAAPALLPHVARRAATALAALDAAAAANPPWLPAEGPSLLGYYIAVLMRWMGQHAKDAPCYVRAADYPALARVLAQLETRPAALRLAEAEGLGATIFTNPA